MDLQTISLLVSILVLTSSALFVYICIKIAKCFNLTV